MRIGLISDLHGNLQALDAVLDALAGLDVSAILCAGDLVCYGADHAAVLQRLQDHHIPAVKGNYDEAVACNLPTASRKPSSPRNEPLKIAALQWTQTHIASRQREQLAALPWTARFRYGSAWVQVIHAGLEHLDQWITPEVPDEMRTLAEAFPGDIVVMGHSHRQFAERVGGSLLVNPGAVGRSLDGDPRAAFAVLDTNTRQVEFHRIAYDLEAAVRAIAESGMPPEIARLIAAAARRIEELDPITPAQETGA